MDSLTHLAAGALTPLAFPRTPARAAVVAFGIAVGQLPDMDFIFGTSPEARLMLHRAVTHALFWQPFLVLLAVLPFYIWMRRRRPQLLDFSNIAGPCPPLPAHQASDGAPGFFAMYAMALAAGYMHIFLDSLTTFGTQILLPLSDVRVGLPAMFIVDPLLTVPLLVLLCKALRAKPDIASCGLYGSAGDAPGARGVAIVSIRARKLALAGLAWALLYPLLALGINSAATMSMAPRLAPEGRLTLLTELFSPLVWKAVVDEGDSYRLGMLNLAALGSAVIDERYEKPDPALYAALKEQEPLFAVFEQFCSFMVQRERLVSPRMQENYQRPLREISFVDIRYLVERQSPSRLLGLSEAYFVLEARVNDTGALVAYRFLQRGEADRDLPWIELF